MVVTLERAAYLLIAVIFLSAVSLINADRVSNTLKISEIIEHQDKSLANIDLRDQSTGVFNKYDYLFIGMNNNHKSDIVYRLKADNTTLYRIKRNAVSPKSVYEALIKIQAFKDNINYEEGLEYKWVVLYDNTGNRRLGVDFN